MNSLKIYGEEKSRLGAFTFLKKNIYDFTWDSEVR